MNSTYSSRREFLEEGMLGASIAVSLPFIQAAGHFPLPEKYSFRKKYMDSIEASGVRAASGCKNKKMSEP